MTAILLTVGLIIVLIAASPRTYSGYPHSPHIPPQYPGYPYGNPYGSHYGYPWWIMTERVGGFLITLAIFVLFLAILYTEGL